jgi:hypothetical protein
VFAGKKLFCARHLRFTRVLPFSTVFPDSKLWCFDGENVVYGAMFLAAEGVPLSSLLF